MTIQHYSERSVHAIERLINWGFTEEVQQRMGALGIVWGIFETNLESTVWALLDEIVSGTRPSTDTTTVSQWIKVLGKGSSKFNDDAQNVLQLTAETAEDLMTYRHSIVHGTMIPNIDGPTFIRNPQWNRELRKRPSSDAHVSVNLLNMAISTAWILCRVVFAVRSACADTTKTKNIVALKNEVIQAKRHANELRHLTALMNDPKY